jgi:hypothetical protein
MPRGDGTGPAGMGPMTGRAGGYCAGYAMPGFENQYPGGGRRVGAGAARGGFGRGRGYRNMYFATGLPVWARYDPYASAGPVPYETDYHAEDEISALKEQAQILKEQFDSINARIDEMTVQEKQEKKEQKK